MLMLIFSEGIQTFLNRFAEFVYMIRLVVLHIRIQSVLNAW